MAEDGNMDELVEAISRDEPGFPAATAPESPLPPAEDSDEFKYIKDARQQYVETGRPPRGYGVRVYGNNIIVRRLNQTRGR